MKTFESNITKIYGYKGKQWIIHLPQIIKEISDHWQLSHLTPISNLSHHYVLSGFRNSKPIILKLGFNAEELDQEAQALKAFEGYGTVKLLDQKKGVLLIERVIPVEPLSIKNQKAIQVACEVMKRLHHAPIPTAANFPHIADQLTILDQDWNLPTPYLQKARELKNNLLKIPAKTVFLHGDLHHGNILSNNINWAVIDPKGIIGYEINEVWAFIMDIQKDTQFVADYFNFNLNFVRQWYFVHLIFMSVNSIKNNTSPDLFINLSTEVYNNYIR